MFKLNSFQRTILCLLSGLLFLLNGQQINTNSYYRLTTQWQGENKSMDISGKTIYLNTSHQGTSQQWKFTDLGNGYYRLTNRQTGTGKSIDLYQANGYFKPQLVQSGNYSGQNWKVQSLGGGYFRLTSMWQGDGKSLDVLNNGVNNQLVLSKTGAYSGQYWKLTAIDPYAQQRIAAQQAEQRRLAAQRAEQERQRQVQLAANNAQAQANRNANFNRSFSRANFPNYLYGSWNNQSRVYKYNFKQNFIEWSGNRFNIFDVAYNSNAGVYRIVAKYYTNRIHQNQTYVFFMRVNNANQINIQKIGPFNNYDYAYQQNLGYLAPMYKRQNSYNAGSQPRSSNPNYNQPRNTGRKAAAAVGAAAIGAAAMTGKAIKKTGQAYQQAGRKVYNASKPVVKKTGRAIAKGSRKTANTTKRVAKKTGKTIAKGTKKAGRAVGKGLKKAGKGIGNLFKKKKKKKKKKN